jgi:hypothetical protein
MTKMETNTQASSCLGEQKFEKSQAFWDVGQIPVTFMMDLTEPYCYREILNIQLLTPSTAKVVSPPPSNRKKES